MFTGTLYRKIICFVIILEICTLRTVFALNTHKKKINKFTRAFRSLTKIPDSDHSLNMILIDKPHDIN